MKSQNQTHSRIILSHCPLPTAVEPQVHIFNLSDALAEFRARLEREAGAPVWDVETRAAFVLDDLCRFLGFDSALRAKVLGQEAVAQVDRFLDEIGIEEAPA